MSRFIDQDISCPHCGNASIESIATSLNVTHRADLREAIRNGTFQRFTCKNCAKSFLVDSQMLYTDFDKKYWFMLFPATWEMQWKENENKPQHYFHDNMSGPRTSPIARRMAEGFTVRSVFGLAALAEKIYCLDAQIDDAALAVLKLLMMQEIPAIPFHPAARPQLREVKNDVLHFTFPVEENGTLRLQPIAIPRSALDDILTNPEYDDLMTQLRAGAYVDAGRILLGGETTV